MTGGYAAESVDAGSFELFTLARDLEASWFVAVNVGIAEYG